MEDQSKFLEMLEEIKNIAVSQQNKMTKDEIKSYLSDMKIDEDKFEAVYHYLASFGVDISGYHFIPDPVNENSENLEENAANKSDEESGDEQYADSQNASNDAKDSDIEKMVKASEKGESDFSAKDRAELNRKLYEAEVNSIEELGEDSVYDTLSLFLKGDKIAREAFINSRLKDVIKTAEGYKDREALKKGEITVDELIGEGNLGLLVGISVIEQNVNSYSMTDGTPDIRAIDGTIHMEIVHAMENCIDEVTKDKDWESAVLARTNLLHEAAKYMTEEIGRVPTKEELSEYTKIPKEEIENIMGLSEDTKRVADTK